MAVRLSVVLSATALALVAAAGNAAGQEQSEAIGGPVTTIPVLNAPFAAEMTLTISRAGMVKTSTALYFRDSAGRVRVEYQAPGPHGGDIPMILVKPEPASRLGYTVDPVAKTLRPAPIASFRTIFNGPEGFTRFHGSKDDPLLGIRWKD